MSQKMEVAAQNIKAANSEMVQWENRLQYVQEQVKNLNAQKEKLEQEIEAKRTDYNLYMNSKDAETKRLREELLADQAQLEKNKTDMLEVLKKVKQDQFDLDAMKKDLENEKNKTLVLQGNVQQFIIAVQRAFSVIGG